MEDFQDFIEFIDEDPYAYPTRTYLRDASNPMEVYDEVAFQKRFRFKKDVVLNVILPILNQPDRVNKRGLPVPPVIQLLIALRFFATGHIQITGGDLHKLSQPTVCKIIARTSKSLAIKIGQFIKFPMPNELNEIKKKIHQQAQFPGVIGCIDCTHVPIQNPTREHGEVFRNRKGQFSINVQIVCGPNMEIYDIVARWPGSAHDSRIFSNSRCCLRFYEGDLRGILIGDSGYAQSSYMFTPIINPQTPAQQRYNSSHISTRNVIERLNGVLKRRYACLSRKLQNKLCNIPNIIVACAVLHNISIMVREELPQIDHEEDAEVPVAIINDNERGSIIRAAFIARHFN